MIDPVLRQVHPLGLPLLVAGSDISSFPELEREGETPSRRTHRRPGLDPERWRRPVSVAALGSRDSGPVPVGSIVFPEFGPDGPSQLVPLGTSEATFLLTQCVLNLDVWRERALIVIGDLLQRAKPQRLLVGSVGEAADLLTARATEAAR